MRPRRARVDLIPQHRDPSASGTHALVLLDDHRLRDSPICQCQLRNEELFHITASFGRPARRSPSSALRQRRGDDRRQRRPSGDRGARRDPSSRGRAFGAREVGSSALLWGGGGTSRDNYTSARRRIGHDLGRRAAVRPGQMVPSALRCRADSGVLRPRPLVGVHGGTTKENDALLWTGRRFVVPVRPGTSQTYPSRSVSRGAHDVVVHPCFGQHAQFLRIGGGGFDQNQTNRGFRRILPFRIISSREQEFANQSFCSALFCTDLSRTTIALASSYGMSTRTQCFFKAYVRTRTYSPQHSPHY